MAGALKIHLYPNMLSTISVKKFFESVKNILEKVKIFIFVVNKSINYILFRVHSTKELMIKAATTTAASRMEIWESGQQFLIPCPRENSWGRERALDKERIIREFVDMTPFITTERWDEESMMKLLKTVKIK